MKLHLTITWARVLAALAAIGALGLAFAWSGVINIGASTGHWAVTDWFLHWSMRNTVRTYAALTVDEPASDPTGLVSAAGHYASHCAICHGAPGERPSPVMHAATPTPPDLRRTADSWSDRQLFWIIKNGVKFTPMPAWPALERDDEVRRMVAFVRRLPDMTAAEYESLARNGPALPPGANALDGALAFCAGCHGEAPDRAAPDVPLLAGQKRVYLAAALRAYATGARASGVMQAAAARFDADTLDALADHYARLEGLAPVRGGAEHEAARIVARGLPERNVPACSKCHGPNKRANYPLLGGQKPEYLAARLRHWRGDPTVVDARKPNAPMPVIARRLPEHLIEPLARYLASPRR